MRQIGIISTPEQALLFRRYLEGCGISTHVDTEDDGSRFWARDEDRLAEAKDALVRFQANPTGTEFRVLADQVAQDEQRRVTAARPTRPIDVRREVWGRSASRRTPVVTALLVTSLFVAIVSGMGEEQFGIAMQSLSFFNPTHISDPAWAQHINPWIDIRNGQLWRLLTPIFIHFGLVHLVLNSWVLLNLGSLLEFRQGSGRMLVLTLITGICGNIGQQIMSPSGAAYGGLSGVLFGLSGYLWIRELRYPHEGLRLPRESLVLLMCFLALGFAGALDEPSSNSRIANWAHLFGFAGGILCAWVLPARRSRFQTKI